MSLEPPGKVLGVLGRALRGCWEGLGRSWEGLGEVAEPTNNIVANSPPEQPPNGPKMESISDKLDFLVFDPLSGESLVFEGLRGHFSLFFSKLYLQLPYLTPMSLP